MSLLRRDFLRLGLLPALSGFIPKARASEQPFVARKGLSIVQGATDDTCTQFSIVHMAGIVLSVQVSGPTGNSILPDRSETKGFTNTVSEVSRIFFSGLSPNQDFILNIYDSANGILLDTRSFRTLDLSKSTLSFALCSCMDDRSHDPEIWQDMVKRRPDVIFFIGDSVYTDQDGKNLVPNPERLWRRFSEARQSLEIYYSSQLIPILAVWDDHDFGGNDSYSNYKYIQESQKNFMTFFAQEPSHCSLLERGPGISSALTLGGQLFLLMDDRSYRLRAGSKDRYAHWGQEQEQWALALLQKHNGPAWFFNGTQIFPQMIFKESVSSDHVAQFNGLLAELKKISSRVVFGSGDVHFSEISQIESAAVGYQTYELTSSGLHSEHFPGVPDVIPNGRRIQSTGEKNYMMVTATAQGMGVQMTVVSHSRRAAENFKTYLTT